jgi:predicted DNA-binding transcriptional regulator YafY
MTRQAKRPQRSEAERRLRQADRLARILRLLQLLSGKGHWNSRALAQEQECSERTIFRDLNVLELAGVPWFFDPERRGYSVRSDFRFPVLNLTDEELMGQATATAITRAPGLDIGATAKPTTEKIAAVSKEVVGLLLQDVERVVTILDLKLADHRRHHEIIQTIQKALVTKKQLSGQYVSPYLDRPVKLVLHPYRLCLVKQAWYLIARSLKEQQPRTYRVPRFKSLRMLETPAEVPQDFDLKEYFGNAWGVFRGEPSYEIEIEFAREAAPLVTGTSWHSTQQAKWHRDGRVTLKFQVDGLDEIVWWILGWSGRCKVIKPPELRERVIARLREALQIHDGS